MAKVKVEVEVDLLKPLRFKIFIRLDSKKPGKEDDGFSQPIEYEKVSYYCLSCKKQGHSSLTFRACAAHSVPAPGSGCTQPPKLGQDAQPGT